MIRFVLFALLFIAPSRPRPAVAPAAPATTRAAFQVVRDFNLSFGHHLGAAEVKRRVDARIATLRAQFAGTIGASSVVWTGYDCVVNVSAFGQNAVGHVAVRDTTVDIRVHLPAILSPLGGNIRAFLTKTATETLRP